MDNLQNLEVISVKCDDKILSSSIKFESYFNEWGGLFKWFFSEKDDYWKEDGIIYQYHDYDENRLIIKAYQ